MQDAGEPLDGFTRAVAHAITRDRPSVDFFEGALLGNGGLGAVVCVRPDAVMVHFGHNNVWDIRLAEEHRDAVGTFRETFDRVKAIPETLERLTDDPGYAAYVQVAQENYRKPYPRPFPCGTLVLGFDRRKAEALGYRLNVADGVCDVHILVEGAPRTLRLFTDVEADRLWFRMIDAGGAPIPAPFDRVRLIPDPATPADVPPFTCPTIPSDVLSFRQVLPFPALRDEEDAAPAPHPKDRAFRLSVRVAARLSREHRPTVEGLRASMGELERAMQAEGPFIGVVQLEEGPASALPDGMEIEAPAPAGEAFDAAARSARTRWQAYWARSAVALDDAPLERTWYRNLYFLNCSVREGVTCPGLFANWSYKNIGTAWHGDYHMNYNTQQPFWATFSSNHVDKHLAYVDMVHRALPVSRAWAKDYYGMRGAFFPHTLYPVEMTMNPYPVPTWGWEVFETPWTVQSLWWHYTYTQDRDFLERRAFEPLREATLFMIDYMTRPEAHGTQWGDDRYHIFPTVPPELYGLTPGFSRNRDGLIDLTLTRFLFGAFIEACRVLKHEQEEQETLTRIRTILDHYPEYPTAESPRGRVFVSVEGEDPEIVYNVPAGTVTVFPGEEHGLHSPPETYAVALNSYRQQQNEGGNELVFLNLQAARLGVLDLERFKRQIRYCTLPNGTCADMALQAKGRYTDTTPFDFMAPMGIWFENFGLPAVIDECLMQSYTGVIRLFPNWPEEKDAAFRTLRAAGAFLVSCMLKDGEIRTLVIESEQGGTCRLFNPWPEAPVSVYTGEQPVDTAREDGVLAFETSAGGRYRISKARRA